jgi:hypothetical protein
MRPHGSDLLEADRLKAGGMKPGTWALKHFFDNSGSIVLDTAVVRSVIYIWYEGSQLRPALVKLVKLVKLVDLDGDSSVAQAVTPEPNARGGDLGCACQAAATGRGRRHSRKHTHMKGGIRDNGEESQGREEEGRQETVS